MSSEESFGPPSSPTVADAPLRAGRVCAYVLAAGVAAALASWGLGEAATDAFRPKTRVVQGSGGPMTIASPAELMATQSKNAALAYGLLGAVLGAALGLAGGLLRGSARAGANAALLGIVLGAALGVASTAALATIYHRFQDRYEENASPNLTVPLLIHGGIWATVGAAGGLAFGIGAGGRRGPRALLGGLVGAAIGAAVYELVGALAFPLDKTVEPISLTWGSRLLARSSVALLAAIGVGCSAVASDRSSTSPPSTSPAAM